MNTTPCKSLAAAGALAVSFTVVLLACCLSAVSLIAEPGATGAVTGTVTNVATGRRLLGASVEVAGMNRSVLTDAGGRFIIRELPVGARELTVSYAGLDPVHETVQIQSGGLRARIFSAKSRT